MTSTAVVLINFRRPALTQAAMSNLQEVAPGLPIIASVDGPYSRSHGEDERSRQETVRIVETQASTSDSVTFIGPQEGRGITAHVEFALEYAFDDLGFENVILLEEDQLIHHEGISFLMSRIVGDQRPVHATAFSSTSHSPAPQAVRLTLFPEQWGVLLNSALFDTYKGLRRDKCIRWRTVYPHFARHLPSMSSAAIAADYWMALFNEVLVDDDQFDGTLQAAACKAGILTYAPWQSGLTDLGGGLGALNPRTLTSGSGDAHDAILRDRHSVATQCLACETRALRRRQLNVLMPLRRRLKVRSTVRRLRRAVAPRLRA